MENLSENYRRLSVESSEYISNKKIVTRVHLKSFTKRFHQPNTHTKKKLIEGFRNTRKIVAGKSHLNVQNFLWRYNNKEKASWIR